MSVDDVKAILRQIADDTDLQVAALRGAQTNLGTLLIELGEVLVGSHQLSPANAAYTNLQIAGRCLKDADDHADRSADLTRAYIATL